MSNFYHDSYKDLDIDHVLFLFALLDNVRQEILSIPEQYLDEPDVKSYVEDKFEWINKLRIELDLLLEVVLH